MLQFSVETARLKIGQLPKEINEPTSQTVNQSVGQTVAMFFWVSRSSSYFGRLVGRSVSQSVGTLSFKKAANLRNMTSTVQRK